MGLRHVHDDVVKHARRRYSDDYDQMESGLNVGTDFNVKIGDVSFRMSHPHYDCTGFSVYVDGILVMTYHTSQATHARFSDEPSATKWHQDAPVLREHIKRAASEIYKRHREQERVRERRDRANTDKDARKLKNFKERFGINE